MLTLVGIVGEKSGSVHPAKLFYTSLIPRLISSYPCTGKKEPGYEANFTHGSSNVPLLIVIIRELLFLQNEQKLHWPK